MVDGWEAGDPQPSVTPVTGNGGDANDKNYIGVYDDGTALSYPSPLGTLTVRARSGVKVYVVAAGVGASGSWAHTNMTMDFGRAVNVSFWWEGVVSYSGEFVSGDHMYVAVLARNSTLDQWTVVRKREWGYGILTPPSSWSWEQINVVARYVKITVQITSGGTTGSIMAIQTHVDDIYAGPYGGAVRVEYEVQPAVNATYTYNATPTLVATEAKIPIKITGGVVDYPLKMDLSGHVEAGWNITGFEDQAGNPLPFWVETPYTSVYVKLPADGDYTIYAVARRGAAMNAGDPTQVFIFFDDFEDGVVDWSIGSALSSVTETNGYVELIANANTWSQLDPSYQYAKSVSLNLSSPFKLEFRLEYIGTSSDLAQMQLRLYNSTGGLRLAVAVNDAWASANPALIFVTPFNSWNGGQNYLPGSGDFVFTVIYNGTAYEFYKDGTLIWAVADEAVGEVTHVVLTNTRYQTYNGKTARYHYVVIAKYSLSEPGHVEEFPVFTMFGDDPGANMTGYEAEFAVPDGYQLTGNNTEYSVEPYNSTHDLYTLRIGASGSTLNFTAKNSVYWVVADDYVARGANFTIEFALGDPFGYGISDNASVLLYEGSTVLANVSVLTAADGYANTTFTAPSHDAVLDLYIVYTGDYVGFDHMVVKSTGVSVVVEVPPVINKGSAFTVNVSANYTVDNTTITAFSLRLESSPDGYAYQGSNSSITFNATVSGAFNFTVLWIVAGNYNYTGALLTVSSPTFTVTGITVSYTSNPAEPKPGDQVSVLIEFKYDTGQYADTSYTVNLYLDGSSTPSLTVTGTGTNVSISFQAGLSNVIEAIVREANGTDVTHTFVIGVQVASLFLEDVVIDKAYIVELTPTGVSISVDNTSSWIGFTFRGFGGAEVRIYRYDESRGASVELFVATVGDPFQFRPTRDLYGYMCRIYYPFGTEPPMLILYIYKPQEEVAGGGTVDLVSYQGGFASPPPVAPPSADFFSAGYAPFLLATMVAALGVAYSLAMDRLDLAVLIALAVASVGLAVLGRPEYAAVTATVGAAVAAYILNSKYRG